MCSSVSPFSLSDSFVVGGLKRTHPTVPGIPGGTRAGAGKIGRMIAEEIMEIHRQVTSSSSLKLVVLNPEHSLPPPPPPPQGRFVISRDVVGCHNKWVGGFY